MDLQAILDESSSSISSEPNKDSITSSAGDLERILREEEDFSDEGQRIPTSPSMSTIATDFHHFNFSTPGLPRDTSVVDHSIVHSSRTPLQKKEISPVTGDQNGLLYDNVLGCCDVGIGVGVGVTGLPRCSPPSIPHNVEDWATLQQILDEDEGEYEGNNWMLKTAPTDKQGSFDPESLATLGKLDVDAILGALRSEDDDDIEKLVKDPVMVTGLLSREENITNSLPVTPSRSTVSVLSDPTPPLKKSVTSAQSSYEFEAIQYSKGEHLPISEAHHTKFSDAALKYAQDYERRLLRPGHREIVSPLHVKRRMQPRHEVGTRHQQNVNKKKPKVNHSNDQPRFGFSGLMESKSMSKLSSRLSNQSDNPGLPTALAVNSKFISIGFQKGPIWVFDLFEHLRQRLGPTTEQMGPSQTAALRGVSATSIDMTENGDALVAGYTNGAIILWDVIKGTVLRNITEAHPSPISSVRFLSGPDMKVVTVDAGGLVHRFTFTKNILWSNYSVDSECLLDGTAGQILAMNVLPPISSIDSMKAKLPKHAAHPFLQNLDLIALSSERSSFAIAVEPVVNVLHRWARPDQERIRASKDTDKQLPQDLPCLSWGWALVSGGGHVATAVLARAWGQCIQFLQANFPDEVHTNNEGKQLLWPAFGVHDEFDVAASVVALEWLGERSLVYLTTTNELTVVDTVMMTLLERLDFSGSKLVYAEFSLSRNAAKQGDSKDATDLCTTFQNSIRPSDGRIMVLGQEEVKTVSILGAKNRISMLEEDGEWLGALALALDHYESTIKSQEDRKRDPDGKRDISKHPEFSSVVRSEDEEWIARLLLRYLHLAVENAPDTEVTLNDRGMQSTARIDLAQSHFQMLAGVCIEFCVVTKRLDLLFGPIFQRFNSVGYTSVFLNVLEPYVLNDKLDYIAPEAMAHFVEHCKANNGVATVERCLLHMDVTIMDFDSILSLLRRNEMYSALIHVYTHGLDDFITPLEVLFEKIFDAADNGQVLVTYRPDGMPQSPFERFGYKIIIFLRNCFSGKTSPQELDLKPSDRLRTLRPQLLHFLLKEQITSCRPSGDHDGREDTFGHRALRYPYAHVLLILDTKAVLDTISLAFDAPDAIFLDAGSNFESNAGCEIEVGADGSCQFNDFSYERKDDDSVATLCPQRQRVMNMLASIILPNNDTKLAGNFGDLRQSKVAVDAFLDFIAKYLMQGIIRASEAVIFLIISRMTEIFVVAKSPLERQSAQKKIIDLLCALSSSSYSATRVLELLQGARINRASLILHQQGVSLWDRGGDKKIGASQHFRHAIECYLEDDDPEFQKNVFDYVKKECTGTSNDDDSETLGEALTAKLPDLVNLDPILSTQLVAELLIEELDEVVASLDGKYGGVAQFKFLHTIISGDLGKIDLVAGPVLGANLTMDHHQVYLDLMAKLHPDMVYHYLSTHDTYRPEDCLKLCQDYDIADASAYLLERMGNVTSALQLILQTLESRLMGLKRNIRGMSTHSYENGSLYRFSSPWKNKQDQGVNMLNKKGKEIVAVKKFLVVALDLCERNSGTSSIRSKHGSQLWFNVLDRLINAKGFLRLAKEQPQDAQTMASILSELMQLTMQRMVSSVPLPDLVHKVTAEHSGSRLGEFREMIATMLSTYGLEHDVCTGAVNVLHYDARCMEGEVRSLKMEGSRIQSIMNHPLKKSLPLGAQGFVEALSHNDVCIKVGASGHASFSDGGLALESRRKNEGLSSVLSLLRSRRDFDTSGKPQGQWNPPKSGLSLMTVSDQLYHAGESSEAAFNGERRVGVLGAAEHFGSFRSFQ